MIIDQLTGEMFNDNGKLIARARVTTYADLRKTPEGREVRKRWEEFWQKKFDDMAIEQASKP